MKTLAFRIQGNTNIGSHFYILTSDMHGAGKGAYYLLRNHGRFTWFLQVIQNQHEFIGTDMCHGITRIDTLGQ